MPFIAGCVGNGSSLEQLPKLQASDWTVHEEIVDWFLAMTKRGTKAAHSVAILTVWHIWKERNAIVFNRDRSSEHAVFAKIKEECSIWASAGEGFLVTSGLSQLPRVINLVIF